MPSIENSGSDIRKELQTISPEQQQIFMKFKEVATAKTPQEKQMAFMKFLGFLKKQKNSNTKSLDSLNTVSSSTPKESILSVTEAIGG